MKQENVSLIILIAAVIITCVAIAGLIINDIQQKQIDRDYTRCLNDGIHEYPNWTYEKSDLALKYAVKKCNYIYNQKGSVTP